MKRYRFLFFLWLIFWLAVWVFSNSNIGIYIFVASIICATVEVLLAFLVKKHLSVQLTSNATAQKKAETMLTVCVQNNSFLGSSKVKVDVCCRNLLTGEEIIKTVYTSVGRRSNVSAEVPHYAEHCGKLSITATKITTQDAFGLASFKKDTDSRTATLILPDIYPVELSVGPQRQMDMSSDEYSMLYPGDDPSETFALREYRPGDKIKNIHWKLSEKIGEPTVRELGLPVNNSLLLLLDNSAIETMPDGSMLEFLGEMAVSVSAALISMQFSHDVAWLDRERNEVAVCHIAGEEDMIAVMSGVLSAVTVKDTQTVLERFSEEHALSEFSHILVLSLNTGNTEEMLGNTSIVHLSPSITDKEGLYVEI